MLPWKECMSVLVEQIGRRLLFVSVFISPAPGLNAKSWMRRKDSGREIKILRTLLLLQSKQGRRIARFCGWKFAIERFSGKQRRGKCEEFKFKTESMQLCKICSVNNFLDHFGKRRPKSIINNPILREIMQSDKFCLDLLLEIYLKHNFKIFGISTLPYVIFSNFHHCIFFLFLLL